MADAPAPLPDHAGHRSRLRARLLGGEADGMADYELVEYLLALAIPRRDTKPLAKTLLREFGSFAQLVSADPESLRRIDGMGDGAIAALKIVQQASLRMLKGEFREKPLLSSWDALLDWLRADMGPIEVERVRVLYLNSRNMLIRDEVASEGSIDQSAPQRKSRTEPPGYRDHARPSRCRRAAGHRAARSYHHRRQRPPQPPRARAALNQEAGKAGLYLPGVRRHHRVMQIRQRHLRFRLHAGQLLAGF